jgi:hypothetical protein
MMSFGKLILVSFGSEWQIKKRRKSTFFDKL